MRGHDPRIHHLRKIYAKWMDPRVKPAGDGGEWARSDSNRPGTAVRRWLANPRQESCRSACRSANWTRRIRCY